jgi:hypothetical protein
VVFKRKMNWGVCKENVSEFRQARQIQGQCVIPEKDRLEGVLLMRKIQELDLKLENLRGQHAEKMRMRVRKEVPYM